jgi:hypothetical protein
MVVDHDMLIHGRGSPLKFPAGLAGEEVLLRSLVNMGRSHAKGRVMWSNISQNRRKILDLAMVLRSIWNVLLGLTSRSSQTIFIIVCIEAGVSDQWKFLSLIEHEILKGQETTLVLCIFL